MRSHHTPNATKFPIRQANSRYTNFLLVQLGTIFYWINSRGAFMSRALLITGSQSPTTSHHKGCNHLRVTFWAFLSCFTDDGLAPASGLLPSVAVTCPFYENMQSSWQNRSLWTHWASCNDAIVDLLVNCSYFTRILLNEPCKHEESPPRLNECLLLRWEICTIDGLKMPRGHASGTLLRSSSHKNGVKTMKNFMWISAIGMLQGFKEQKNIIFSREGQKNK